MTSIGPLWSFVFGNSTPSLVLSTLVTCVLFARFVEVIIRRRIVNNKIKQLEQTLKVNKVRYDDIIRRPVSWFGDDRVYYKSLAVRQYMANGFFWGKLLSMVFKKTQLNLIFNERDRYYEIAELMSHLNKKDLEKCFIVYAQYLIQLYITIERDHISTQQKVSVLFNEIVKLSDFNPDELSASELVLYKLKAVTLSILPYAYKTKAQKQVPVEPVEQEQKQVPIEPVV